MALNQTTSRLNYRNYLKELRVLYQKPVTKTSSALILTLATTAFFAFAAIRPTLATVSQLIKEIENKREVNTKLTQKLAALASVQEEFIAAQDDLQILDTSIPPTHENNFLLLQIEYLSWQNEVAIENIRTDSLTLKSSQVTKGDSTDTFPSFSISLTALSEDRNKLRTLLGDINSLERVVRIESVSFSQSQDRRSNLIELSATIRAYWSPEQSP